MDCVETCFTFVPFQQSVAYAEAARRCGARADWHSLGSDRVLVLQRGRLRTIQRSPVADQGTGGVDPIRTLRALARWPGVTIATPETELASFGLIPLVTPMHTAIWPLTRALRPHLSGKWRNRLTQSENTGIHIAPGTEGTLATLVKANAIQQRARGYRGYSAEFVRALPRSAIRTWYWTHGGTMSAAMAFVVHGSSATYLLGWGSEAARRYGVHTLMLFQAASALQREGICWLDLGSIDTDRAPGLARFKLGTGAAVKRLGATMLVLP